MAIRLTNRIRGIPCAAILLLMLGADCLFGQTLTINVNVRSNVHPISKYIYGLQNTEGVYGGTGALGPTTNVQKRVKDLRVQLMRQGGNNATKYNWMTKMSSHPDYGDLSYEQDNDRTAYVCKDIYGLEPVLTAPMIGVVSGSPPGAQDDSSPYVPTDSTSQSNWMNSLDSQFGRGGVKNWFMDNEPMGWASTHDDVFLSLFGHKNATCNDYFTVYTNYALKMKRQNRDVILWGPEEMNEPFWFYDDHCITGPNLPSNPTYNTNYYEWFIRHAAEVEKQTHVRILDVVSFHYYPTTANDVEVLNNVRTLWDPTYSYPESVGCNRRYGHNRVYFVRRLQSWIDTYFAGTPIGDNGKGIGIALTEMDFRGTPELSGVWYGDLLGVAGREKMHAVTPWIWPIGRKWWAGDATPDGDVVNQIYYPFWMYTHFFGETSVDCRFNGVHQTNSALRAYASLSYSDKENNVSGLDNMLCISVVNIDTVSKNSRIAFNLASERTNIRYYQFQASTPHVITTNTLALFTNGSTLSFPARSFTIINIPIDQFGMALLEKSCSPQVVSNNMRRSVSFLVRAKDNGYLMSMALDLRNVGGPTNLRMNNVSGRTMWYVTAEIPMANPKGRKDIPILMSDDKGNSISRHYFQLDIVDALGPRAPTFTSVKSFQKTNIVLQWTPAIDDTTNRLYQVLKGTNPNLFFKTNVLGNRTSWTDIGPLREGRTYFYAVRGIDQEGNLGNLSATTNFTVSIGSEAISRNSIPNPQIVSNHRANSVSVNLWFHPGSSTITNVMGDISAISTQDTLRFSNISGYTLWNASFLFSGSNRAGISSFTPVYSSADGSVSHALPVVFTVYDSLPPTQPIVTNIHVRRLTNVSVSWDSSRDETGLMGYYVVQGTNRTKLDRTNVFGPNAFSFLDRRAEYYRTNFYQVISFDSNMNLSSFSPIAKQYVRPWFDTLEGGRVVFSDMTDAAGGQGGYWCFRSEPSYRYNDETAFEGLHYGTYNHDVLGTFWDTCNMALSPNQGSSYNASGATAFRIAYRFQPTDTNVEFRLALGGNGSSGFVFTPYLVMPPHHDWFMTNIPMHTFTNGSGLGLRLNELGSVIMGTGNGLGAGSAKQFYDNMVFVIPDGIILTNLVVSPSVISNHVNTPVTFTCLAKDLSGTISNVRILSGCLSSSTNVRMTNISGRTLWRYSHVIAQNTPPGVWSVRMRATDDQNHRKTRTVQIRIVDRQPPASPILLSPVDDCNTNALSLLLRWESAKDHSPVPRYEVDLDGVIHVVVRSTNFQTPTLGFGVHTWRVRGVDEAGNKGIWSASRHFSLDEDLTGPTTPILQIPEEFQLSSDNYKVFRWLPSLDVSGIAGYEMELQGITNRVLGQVTEVIKPALPDGSYDWRVRAIDASVHSNRGPWSGSWSLTVDTVKPSVPTQVWPTNFATNNTRFPIFVWNRSWDVNGISGYDIKIGSREFHAGKSTNFQVPIPLTNGSHLWQVRARDNAGNVSAYGTTRILNLTGDNTPPTIPIRMLPTSNASLATVSPRFLWRKSIETGSGLAYYEFHVDALDPIRTIMTNLTNVMLNPGIHSWRVRSVDAYGNASAWSPVWPFTVDMTGPSIPVQVKPNKFASTNSPKDVRFIWNRSVDPAGIAGYEIDLDGGLSWAGTTNAILTAGLGPHFWRVRAIDGLGNRGNFSEYQVFTNLGGGTLPTTPLALRPLSILSTNSSPVGMRWTKSSAGAGINRYIVDVDGITNNAGLLTNTSTSLLSDGVHTWMVRSVDNLGNRSDYSKIQMFVLDAQAPISPVLHTPRSNSFSKTNGQTLSWKPAFDQNGISRYILEIDGVTNSVLGTTNKTVNGLSFAEHYWRVRVVDSAGNVGAWSALWNFTLDNIPPVAPVPIKMADGRHTNSLNLFFNWNKVNDVSGIHHYEVWLENYNISNRTPLTNTFISYPGSLWETWRVRAVDNAGNVGPWSTGRIIYVDAFLPPAPTTIRPLSGFSTNTNRPTLIWTRPVDEPWWSWVARYEVYIDGTKFDVGTVSNWKTPSLVPGWHTWSVRAVDANSNVGPMSQSQDFRILSSDVLLPSVPNLLAPGNRILTNVAVLLLKWTQSSDASGILGYEVELDGTGIPVTLTNLATLQLPEGVHRWRVRAIDNAGNPSAYTSFWTNRIDVTPPKNLQLVRPLDGVSTNTVTPTFQWTKSSDTNGLAGYEMEVDGVLVSLGTNTNTLSAPLADGIHQWRVRAVDRAGNRGAFSLPRDVQTGFDSTPPSVPVLIGPTEGVTLTNVNVLFVWHAALDGESGVGAYHLNIDGDTNNIQLGTNVLLSGMGTGLHVWSVQAIDKSGNRSAWATSSVFYVDTNNPTVPRLIAPSDLASVSGINCPFVWRQSYGTGGAASYQIEVDGNLVSTGAATNHLEALLASGSHYWRVRAISGDGVVGGFSLFRSFTSSIGGAMLESRISVSNVTLQGVPVSRYLPGSTVSLIVVASNNGGVSATGSVVYTRIDISKTMIVSNSVTAPVGWVPEFSTNLNPDQGYQSFSYSGVFPAKERIRWVRWRNTGSPVPSLGTARFRYRLILK